MDRRAGLAELPGPSAAVTAEARAPPIVRTDTVDLIDGYPLAERRYHHGSDPGVQYAGGIPPEEEPEREYGLNGQELTEAEAFRRAVYNATRAQLARIDPQNLILQRDYLNKPGGFVPTEAEFEELQNALDQARTNGNLPRPVAPLNTSPGFGFAEESWTLRTAAKEKGMFGLESATAEQSNRLGQAWVGDGATVATDGTTLLSKDGLRQYRPPSFKPGLLKTQSNFEQRLTPKREWQSNGHLDIIVK